MSEWPYQTDGISAEEHDGLDLADVSSGLIEAINHLFDEYGPLGVERTVIAMRAQL